MKYEVYRVDEEGIWVNKPVTKYPLTVSKSKKAILAALLVTWRQMNDLELRLRKLEAKKG